ncbi:MAG: PaaI family thioesterase [Pseudomonadota bacterium]|nr:PaaI family thioesterase [Pseudomonadota bacterium]
MSAPFDLSRIAALAASPMGQWLGFTAVLDGDGAVYRLSFSEEHIGNPMIRALHGGVIAAFLETAMRADLTARLETTAAVSVVNMAIDYLASSRAEDMQGRVRLLRLGRRVAFLEATGWQQAENAPVAVGRACLRIA